jgi:hypothetical protein
MWKPSVLTAALSAIFALTFICLAMPKPPEGAVTFLRGKTEYYSGTVYLSSHDDTVKLKDLGFRDFAFDSRSFGSVKYRAEWPMSVVELPLPAYVNGLDYDVSENEDADADSDSSLILQVPGTPGASGHHRSAEDQSYGGASIESKRKLMEDISDMIYCHARPGNGKPDSVINGREYVHGHVTLRSLADTVDLVPFGFVGLDPEPDGGTTWDFSALGLGVITYSAYRAWWPMDVPVKMLPDCVYGLQADRMRRGSGEVVIKRKSPLK